MESEVARLGFGYDSATDDYKVVRIMEFRTSNGFCSSEVKVYGLKSNSWKRVQNLPSNHRYFGSYIHCLNSALHWLTNPDLGNTFIILTLYLGNLQLLDGNAVIVQRQHQDPSTSKKGKFANRQFSFMSI
ncbi:hypothetical protein GBA52_000389 [Prunus armeniaca]|nr:hypothetical protein GBA52_000389 [Prunus armeniaca]